MVPTEDPGQKRQVSKKREQSENECRNVKGRRQNVGTGSGGPEDFVLIFPCKGHGHKLCFRNISLSVVSSVTKRSSSKEGREGIETVMGI